MDRKDDVELYFRATISDAHSLHEVLDGLVALRKALGLTQRELGSRMGVSQSAVSAIEAEDSNPLIKTLQKYARVLDAKLDFKIDYSKYVLTRTTFSAKSEIIDFPKTEIQYEYERMAAS